MQIYSIFALIFSLLLFIFFYFHPFKLSLVDKAETPQLLVQTLTLYKIDENGTQGELIAKNAKRFVNRYEIDFIKAHETINHQQRDIEADAATVYENNITLMGNVLITQHGGISLKGSKLQYLRDQQLLISQYPFEAMLHNSKVRGSKLHYDTKTKELNATDITATLYTQELE